MSYATIEQPSWAQVEAAILRLDESVSQEVYLHPDQADVETWLCIGGGAGDYIATGSDKGRTFPTYADARKPAAPTVALTIGGQIGDYPANWVIGIDKAVMIAKAFFDAGGFECGIEWQEV